MKLTPKEIDTIKTYNQNASEWTVKHSTKDFWGKEMRRFHDLLPSGNILEIGCGGGRDAKELIQLGYDYIGIDVSEELLKEAKKACPNATFLHQSIYELDFPENYFDGFWTSATLLHIPKNRIDEALVKIKNIVKSNGIGFISIKKGKGEKVEEDEPEMEDKKPRLFSYYQEKEFNEILERNNFEIIGFKERPMSEKTIWLVYFVKARK